MLKGLSRLLAVVALALTAIPALAVPSPEYFYIQDTSDGERRLLGEKNSLAVGTNKHGIKVVSGRFAFFNIQEGKMQRPVSVAIAIDSCSSGGGQLVAAVDGEDSTKEFFFTMKGPKMFDTMGTILCTALMQAAKESHEQKPTSSRDDI